MDGLDHPYAAARVRVALRLCDGAEARRDADARRWPIVGGVNVKPPPTTAKI